MNLELLLEQPLKKAGRIDLNVGELSDLRCCESCRYYIEDKTYCAYYDKSTEWQERCKEWEVSDKYEW